MLAAGWQELLSLETPESENHLSQLPCAVQKICSVTAEVTLAVTVLTKWQPMRVQLQAIRMFLKNLADCERHISCCLTRSNSRCSAEHMPGALGFLLFKRLPLSHLGAFHLHSIMCLCSGDLSSHYLVQHRYSSSPKLC